MRVIATYNVYSHTVDEPNHLAAGLARWSNGGYTLDALHPPFARVIIALGPYAAGARSVGEAQVRREGSAVMRTGRGYESNLWLARFGVLPFFLVACSLVWWWGARIGGPAAGAFSVVIFTLTPAIVAHAGLATTDMPLAATLLGTCAAWLLWAEHPRSLKRAVVLGAAAGAAVATKFSAIPYFGALAVTSLFFLRPWRAADTRELARALGVAVLAAVGVLWAAHGFSVGWAGGVFTPFPEFFIGLGQLARHNAAGHFTYLLGSPALSGQVAFFPVVLLVKTPLALLLLMGFGAAWAVQQWRRSGKKDHGALLPLLIAGAVLVVAMAANINAGVRHILPIYAFLAVVAGAFVARAWIYRGTLRSLAAAFLGLYLIESATAHPDALAYFNVLVPNERGRVLVDSDLDWGQDLHRLRDTTRARGITHLALAYYGSGDRARDVLPALRPLSQHAPDTGWVAISETYYRIGAISNAGGRWAIDTTAYRWLRGQELVARVGKSIRLYRVPVSVLR
ncbi:MAG: ArnT family glycosyltransferase [Gemmatimonadaceae bacterium]